jgi:hypothetical protein
VLESVWDGNWTLVPFLINFAFDPDVRPFRRNQALDLLIAFFNNRRLRTVSELARNVEPRLAEIEKLLSDNTIRVSTVNLTSVVELMLIVSKLTAFRCLWFFIFGQSRYLVLCTHFFLIYVHMVKLVASTSRDPHLLGAEL